MSTPTGYYTVTVTGVAGSLTRSTQVTLIVNPSGVVGGTVFGVDELAPLALYVAYALLVSTVFVMLRVYQRRKHRSWMRAAN